VQKTSRGPVLLATFAQNIKQLKRFLSQPTITFLLALATAQSNKNPPFGPGSRFFFELTWEAEGWPATAAMAREEACTLVPCCFRFVPGQR